MLTSDEIGRATAERRLWCDALEGKTQRKYEQTQEKLAEEDYEAFCCLGVVLMERGEDWGVAQAGSGKFQIENPDFDDEYEDPYITLDSELTEDQLARLGLSFVSQGLLIQCNDSAEMDFEAIARVIMALPYESPRDVLDRSTSENNCKINEWVISHIPDLFTLEQADNIVGSHYCTEREEQLKTIRSMRR